MDPDDLPRPKKRWIEPLALDPFSVEDLQTYAEALEAEIVRVRAAMDGKQSHRLAAEAFFRK